MTYPGNPASGGRQPQVICLVGPTAAGKSALAVQLAQRLPGEIVNADAMQLYRGMDIGTGKLSVAERGGVAHHLLDVWEVTQRASVADFQRLARSAVTAILARGRSAILTGGSGLYVAAALDDLRFPGTDPQLRAHWEGRLAEVGAAALHAELARRSPEAAAAIGENNGRRLVRALEVADLTGSVTARLPQPRAIWPGTIWLGLDPGVAELDQRIAVRVEQMFADGLAAEVRALEAAGLRRGVTASRALGYHQLLDGRPDPLGRTVTATRRFARRQRGWFGRDRRISWLAPEASLPTALLLVQRESGLPSQP